MCCILTLKLGLPGDLISDTELGCAQLKYQSKVLKYLKMNMKDVLDSTISCQLAAVYWLELLELACLL